MEIEIKVSEAKIRQLITDWLEQSLGPEFLADPKHLVIEVKSRQNYRSEWEAADFRAVYRA